MPYKEFSAFVLCWVSDSWVVNKEMLFHFLHFVLFEWDVPSCEPYAPQSIFAVRHATAVFILLNVFLAFILPAVYFAANNVIQFLCWLIKFTPKGCKGPTWSLRVQGEVDTTNFSCTKTVEQWTSLSTNPTVHFEAYIHELLQKKSVISMLLLLDMLLLLF